MKVHSTWHVAALLASLLAAASVAAAERGVDGDRFRIEGAITPRAVSDDGRFGLQASFTTTDGKRSPDGRFALKAVNVPAGGCAPAPDAMFVNGFEP
jgi:hypothetical protein